MSEVDPTSLLIQRIQSHRLGWIIRFLIASHIPLRGMASIGLQGFSPLVRVLFGAEFTESLEAVLESPEQVDNFLRRIESA